MIPTYKGHYIIDSLTFRNILQYWDFVYKRTSDGQEFFKHCNLVHAFAEDIIEKRQKILVSKLDLILNLLK